MEHLVPDVDQRWVDLVDACEHLGSRLRGGLQDAERIPRGLRRLWRDRDHQRGQDDRGVGRGPELPRSGRGLDQPPAVAGATARTTIATTSTRTEISKSRIEGSTTRSRWSW